MTSSVFLKKQERIVALAMIMCLCLLVYTIAQRYMRHQLAKREETVRSQTGKSTKRPTMKWIFQVLEGVHVLLHNLGDKIQEHVLNLNEHRRHILRVLGPLFEEIYSGCLQS